MKITMPLIGILLVLSVSGCGGGKPAVKEEVVAKEPENANLVTLEPEKMHHVKVGKPTLINVADKLQAPSQVEVDEHRLVRVGANVTGRIIDVYAMLGDNVEAGAELARISSPELTQAQLAYLRAFSLETLAEKAAERARHLLAADVISIAEMQRRESELQVSRAELGAAADQLRLLGMDSRALSKLGKDGTLMPSVAIKSSKPGVVIERNVAIGQVVQPSDLLFQVADLSSVWVVGDVPEQIARHVQVGQHVEIHVPALGNISFDGLIIFVADTVNPLTRTVMVRTVVENPRRKLKPAMLASMHILDNPVESLVVPETAVVRENNQDYIFLAQGDNRFLRVPVELGAEVGDVRPVLKGLSIDQTVVVDGAFHLENERKLAELE
ncbi:cobalt-zinc-cadmium efflux system membrane fusion protein [Nitrosospira multiformis]|uniref:Cobalt-zinc-cadmium efflux system membrane fusion protein n=1 Tax=Nitrosospira multiformis TaxID=1231 RepID=A0A1I7GRX5_9PROT|nr:efflux RND transporter periplasmic adaptor subunit [Nitrosospira multiformis]PTQ82487.1 cobalt-zinc-cadmium efflux system membrane fusion protein [Nitrosospira multiformis]SFU51016.1 membrane fusion protein, cobalt-zinc-cadmium efflux system [Nitrosospira multiformis]